MNILKILISIICLFLDDNVGFKLLNTDIINCLFMKLFMLINIFAMNLTQKLKHNLCLS